MSIARRAPLAVDVRGPGPTDGAGRAGSLRLLFVHGSLDTGRSFSELRQALSDAGATDWRTVSYDRRGYGASLPPPNPTPSTTPNLPPDEPFLTPRLDDQLADLEDLAADGGCVLFGHSLGGVLALAVAARRPDLVRGVICYEAPMPWLPTWPRAPLPEPAADGSISGAGARDAAERFLRRAMGDPAWAALGSDRRERMLTWAPAWAAELVELSDGGWPFDPRAVTCDVLILNGTDSEERHRRGSAEWLRHLPAAHAVSVPGGTHVGHRQRAVEVVAAIRPFLAGHRG